MLYRLRYAYSYAIFQHKKNLRGFEKKAGDRHILDGRPDHLLSVIGLQVQC